MLNMRCGRDETTNGRPFVAARRAYRSRGRVLSPSQARAFWAFKFLAFLPVFLRGGRGNFGLTLRKKAKLCRIREYSYRPLGCRYSQLIAQPTPWGNIEHRYSTPLVIKDHTTLLDMMMRNNAGQTEYYWGRTDIVQLFRLLDPLEINFGQEVDKYSTPTPFSSIAQFQACTQRALGYLQAITCRPCGSGSSNAKAVACSPLRLALRPLVLSPVYSPCLALNPAFWPSCSCY